MVKNTHSKEKSIRSAIIWLLIAILVSHFLFHWSWWCIFLIVPAGIKVIKKITHHSSNISKSRETYSSSKIDKSIYGKKQKSETLNKKIKNRDFDDYISKNNEKKIIKNKNTKHVCSFCKTTIDREVEYCPSCGSKQ